MGKWNQKQLLNRKALGYSGAFVLATTLASCTASISKFSFTGMPFFGGGTTPTKTPDGTNTNTPDGKPTDSPLPDVPPEGSGTPGPQPSGTPVPQPTRTNEPLAGSCQPSSSLSVSVIGKNVVSYVPKGSWVSAATGIVSANIEGTSIRNTFIPTTSVVNSCASNPNTGHTVCSANTADVYVLTVSSGGVPQLSQTLITDGGKSIGGSTPNAPLSPGFSGGTCINCGVVMDGMHNRAVISMSIGNRAAFQFINLTSTAALGSSFKFPSMVMSEDLLLDPITNWLLSPAENGNFDIVNLENPASPKFYQYDTGVQRIKDIYGGQLAPDSAGEDCSTGIALAPLEYSDPANPKLFITDLTQARFTDGTPSGSWNPNSASQVVSLSETSLAWGANAIAIAQGTHIGIVTGEFGGSGIAAIKLPSTSGSGMPNIVDYVGCMLPALPSGGAFDIGDDPHTITAYMSPNSGDAMAVLSNRGATYLAVVNLTKLLDTSVINRSAAGHRCGAGTIPSNVVSYIDLRSI